MRYLRRVPVPLRFVMSLLLAAPTLSAATFTVINTADAGAGSLRQAISDANANPGADTIAFAIPGAGPHVFQPATALPPLTSPAVLDGSTQAGSDCAAGTLKIVLDGVSISGSDGLRVFAGAVGSTIRGLVVQRFFQGISVGATGSTVVCSFVGTDVSGASAMGNRRGIVAYASDTTIGGTVPEARNVISGNGTGILLQSTPPASPVRNVRIEGNRIGTNLAGTAAVPNLNGIQTVTPGGGTFEDLVIGGAAAGAGNLISGNGEAINVHRSSGTVIQGNRIGTDATGGLAIPNTIVAVTLQISTQGRIGGPGIAGNVVAGNGGGVQVANATGITVEGNLIGLAVDGITPMGQTTSGLYLFNADVDVLTNRIAHNGNAGVTVLSGSRARITGNSIYGNGALGIRLDAGGIANDPLDADAGSNGLQNHPILTRAVADPASTAVEGRLSSQPSTTYVVQFFGNTACDASGAGEGETFLGETTVTTDAAGDATFAVTLGAAATILTATATDPDGNTSEFSPCLAATLVAVPVTGSAGLVLLLLALAAISVWTLRNVVG